MANNIYIGSRYVPIFTGAWNETMTYEPLTIVEYGNSTYTSKKPVPAGTVPTNTEYWALTGNYNGQISNLQNQINDIRNYYINALDIGFKNDGVTNNSVVAPTIFDNSDYDGRCIYFPAGKYLFTEKIVITRPLGIIGELGTVFRSVANDDFFVYISVSDPPFYDRKFLIDTIDFDCNNYGGIALDHFYNSAIRNVRIRNYTNSGLKTRYTNTASSAQLHVDNIDFENGTGSVSTAIAINDNGNDNVFNNIDVVNAGVGYKGNGVVNNTHIWTSFTAMCENSTGIISRSGKFSNVVFDTLAVGMKYDGVYNGNVVLQNLKVVSNDAVNVNHNKIVVIDNSDNPEGNVAIFGAYIGTSDYKMVVDFAHSVGVEICGVSYYTTVTDANNAIVDGKTTLGAQRAILNHPTTLANLTREGFYQFDNGDHAFSDKPAGQGLGNTGWVLVRQINGSAAVLQIIYSNGVALARVAYNGVGNWYKFVGTAI